MRKTPQFNTLLLLYKQQPMCWDISCRYTQSLVTHVWDVQSELSPIDEWSLSCTSVCLLYCPQEQTLHDALPSKRFSASLSLRSSTTLSSCFWWQWWFPHGVLYLVWGSYLKCQVSSSVIIFQRKFRIIIYYTAEFTTDPHQGHHNSPLSICKYRHGPAHFPELCEATMLLHYKKIFLVSWLTHLLYVIFTKIFQFGHL